MRSALTRKVDGGQHPLDVAKTIVRQVRRDAWKPETRIITQRILRPYAPPTLELRGDWIPPALHTWARDNLTLLREPHVEFVQTLERLAPPPFALGSGAGDCDDMTLAMCTVLESVGIPSYVGLTRLDEALYHVFPVSAEDWEGPNTPAWILDPQWRVPAKVDFGSRDRGLWLLPCGTPDEGALQGREIANWEVER